MLQGDDETLLARGPELEARLQEFVRYGLEEDRLAGVMGSEMKRWVNKLKQRVIEARHAAYDIFLIV